MNATAAWGFGVSVQLLGGWAGRLQSGRVADDGKAEPRRVVETAGNRAGLIERDAGDQLGAAVEIVDAEPVALHADKQPGNPPRQIETERERAGQIGLGV